VARYYILAVLRAEAEERMAWAMKVEGMCIEGLEKKWRYI
jgi:hypothetical protein